MEDMPVGDWERTVGLIVAGFFFAFLFGGLILQTVLDTRKENRERKRVNLTISLWANMFRFRGHPQQESQLPRTNCFSVRVSRSFPQLEISPGIPLDAGIAYLGQQSEYPMFVVVHDLESSATAPKSLMTAFPTQQTKITNLPAESEWSLWNGFAGDVVILRFTGLVHFRKDCIGTCYPAVLAGEHYMVLAQSPSSTIIAVSNNSRLAVYFQSKQPAIELVVRDGQPEMMYPIVRQVTECLTAAAAH